MKKKRREEEERKNQDEDKKRRAEEERMKQKDEEQKSVLSKKKEEGESVLRAKFAYTALRDDELSFKKGETVTIVVLDPKVSCCFCFVSVFRACETGQVAHRAAGVGRDGTRAGQLFLKTNEKALISHFRVLLLYCRRSTCRDVTRCCEGSSGIPM
jgi:hypothetical protein